MVLRILLLVQTEMIRLILHINIAIIHKYRADTSWELLDTWNIIRVSVWSLCAAVCAACYLWYLQSFSAITEVITGPRSHCSICRRSECLDKITSFNTIITTPYIDWPLVLEENFWIKANECFKNLTLSPQLRSFSFVFFVSWGLWSIRWMQK